MSALMIHCADPLAEPPAPPADSLAEAVALLREIRDALAARRLEDRLAIDVKELALALGISERSIWTLNSSGGIPSPFKAQGRTLWDIAELRRWMDAGRPRRDEWERLKHRRK
jgi:predicted DNA-binding transcriptional regulator AlpA